MRRGALSREGADAGFRVCHCGQCLRTHGHAPGYSKARVAETRHPGRRRRDLVRIIEGSKARLLRQMRIRVCFWRMEGADGVSITAGSLKTPTGLKTARHIFTADQRAITTKIATGAPQDRAPCPAIQSTFLVGKRTIIGSGKCLSAAGIVRDRGACRRPACAIAASAVGSTARPRLYEWRRPSTYRLKGEEKT